MYSSREILNELIMEEIELIVNHYLPKKVPLHMDLGASYTKTHKEKYLTLSNIPENTEITLA